MSSTPSTANAPNTGDCTGGTITGKVSKGGDDRYELRAEEGTITVATKITASVVRGRTQVVMPSEPSGFIGHSSRGRSRYSSIPLPSGSRDVADKGLCA